MAYSDERSKRVDVLVAGIHKNPNATPATKTLLEDYWHFCKANGRSDSAIIRKLYSLNTFIQYVGKKDLLTLTRKDIENAMEELEASNYSPQTKVTIKTSVKAAYRHWLGADLAAPAVTAWISTSLSKANNVQSTDMLTEDDIKKLLNQPNDLRNRFFIALLYDSGCRISEILNMRIKDCHLNEDPATISVHGKTGTRIIPIVFSNALASQYLEQITKHRKPSEYLWGGLGKWSGLDKADYQAFRKMLMITAKNAKVSKPCNFHNFRHSRATFYASRITESELRTFFGWTAKSDMPATYVHLSGRDINNSVLVANGIKPKSEGKEKVSELLSKLCPRCSVSQPNGSIFCAKCGAPMDPALAMKRVEQNKWFEAYQKNPTQAKINMLLDSPDVKKGLVALMEKAAEENPELLISDQEKEAFDKL